MTQLRLGTQQNFTTTAASQAGSKFGAQTYKVRVATGSTQAQQNGVYVLFGDSTALTISSTNGHLVPNQWVDYFDVTPGQTPYLLSASTLFGTVTVTELS